MQSIGTAPTHTHTPPPTHTHPPQHSRPGPSHSGPPTNIHRDGQVGTAGPSCPGGTAAAYSCMVFGGQAHVEREAAELRQEQPEAAPSAAIRPATFGTAQLDTLRDQQLTPLHPLAGRSYS